MCRPHLWPWALGSEHKIKIIDTSNRNAVPQVGFWAQPFEMGLEAWTSTGKVRLETLFLRVYKNKMLWASAQDASWTSPFEGLLGTETQNSMEGLYMNWSGKALGSHRRSRKTADDASAWNNLLSLLPGYVESHTHDFHPGNQSSHPPLKWKKVSCDICIIWSVNPKKGSIVNYGSLSKWYFLDKMLGVVDKKAT